MRQIAHNLYQSRFDFPFGKEKDPKKPSCKSAAYLLVQKSGNILFYSSRFIDEHFDFISEKGGLSLQLLNHRDEASSSSDTVEERFGAPLACHALEREVVEKLSRVGKTVSGGEVFGEVRAIHTPGHAPGSVCFLVEREAGPNILFTGDTFFPCQIGDIVQWRVFISEKNQEKMICSLKILRELRAPLLLIPSLFIGKKSYEGFDDQKRYQSAIDECIIRLNKGERH